jgi:hypothetical protein
MSTGLPEDWTDEDQEDLDSGLTSFDDQRKTKKRRIVNGLVAGWDADPPAVLDMDNVLGGIEYLPLFDEF